MAQKTLRCLVLGDSLLDGYLGVMDCPMTPPQKFQTLFEEKYSPTKAFMHTITIPGIRTKDLLKRFADQSQQIPPCDLAIVLCGTNDLGFGFGADAVYEQLSKIYSAVQQHSSNCHLIVTTVPDSASVREDLIKRRDDLNDMIRATALAHTTVMDLSRSLPFDRIGPRWFPKKNSSSQWHMDGLHFSPQGYVRIGELYFEHLETHGWLQSCFGKQ